MRYAILFVLWCCISSLWTQQLIAQQFTSYSFPSMSIARCNYVIADRLFELSKLTVVYSDDFDDEITCLNLISPNVEQIISSVSYIIVSGKMVIDDMEYIKELAGEVVRLNKSSE